MLPRGEGVAWGGASWLGVGLSTLRLAMTASSSLPSSTSCWYGSDVVDPSSLGRGSEGGGASSMVPGVVTEERREVRVEWVVPIEMLVPGVE